MEERERERERESERVNVENSPWRVKNVNVVVESCSVVRHRQLSVIDVLLCVETTVLHSATQFSTETGGVICRKRTAASITIRQKRTPISLMLTFHLSLTT